MAKMGRPKANNPKSIRFGIRLDEETADILKAYCDKYNISKGEAIRQAIQNLNQTAK